ncbi:E3 ubiquitin-protein ligase TRIM39-like [Sinocyclocheilus rhinocerous]|uniref:E3 ubiquitin-protein ligase TRIM39-like n=1 Tax=Sinocyclocheilus rhinocerous TaxID=307959 RepID=UPI0007B88AAC|nr:PREDICTED: E3 ubiquitin-protein ligase TRIM39-like [Sinocyclocheilus rhinocerous]
MASSSGPLNEELQCSICLDGFTDPVTTPCGHNFCRTCLNKHWTNTHICFCPLCKEKFSRRPDLKINITLREVVQHFNEKLNPGRSEVFCDFCEGIKQKAMKSCLTCQSSYCETHLEPHHRVQRLKKHTLINAVENLEDYICQKHERPLELFCRDDQMSVCLSCTEGDHRTHNTVPIEEESQQKKARLVQTQAGVQQMIQDRMKKIQEIQHSVENRKQEEEADASRAEGIEIFTDLILSIQRCQSELLLMMEEQQKAAEKQAEDLIKELQQEITDLKKRNTELEQLSHTDDHLHLLLVFSFLHSHLHTKNWTEISIDSDVNVLSLHRALTQLEKTYETLNEKLCQTGLKWAQKYTVDVTLDPDTAYPYLILSDDGKHVSLGDIEQDVPENPKRFDVISVLAKEGFSSGKFYYEVQVKGKTEWNLGVARESINRKETNTMAPVDGYWAVILRNENEYDACENPSVSLSLRVKPEIVGVFVDYEEGLVSFYDVESSFHIHSFTGQTFTDRLYPYFSPGLNDEGKNSKPLIISPRGRAGVVRAPAPLIADAKFLFRSGQGATGPQPLPRTTPPGPRVLPRGTPPSPLHNAVVRS